MDIGRVREKNTKLFQIMKTKRKYAVVCFIALRCGDIFSKCCIAKNDQTS